MDVFGKIAERKIAEAVNDGLFDDLPGSGKPLRLEDESWIPEDLRASYRILKNSGYIPPELELRKEIINLKSLIQTIDDEKERLKKIREFDFKLLKINMTRKRPLNIGDFPEYEGKIMEKTLLR
jgi:hypothetical protein